MRALTDSAQGSGAVRAGQWARALCLNEGLDTGSVLPYVARLQQRNIGVIVLNPNNNARVEIDAEELRKRDPFVYWTTQSKQVRPLVRPLSRVSNVRPAQPDLCVSSRTPIPGNAKPEEHCVSVWDELCAGLRARVGIVAHSYGGNCTLALLQARREELLPRLAFAAFTDSVHAVGKREAAEVSAEREGVRCVLTRVSTGARLSAGLGRQLGAERTAGRRAGAGARGARRLPLPLGRHPFPRGHLLPRHAERLCLH